MLNSIATVTDDISDLQSSYVIEPVNILIVDDLPEKVLAYKTILEELGQNIVVAYSGEEALIHVIKQEFAVILLDVNMPGIDGFETATAIRGRKKSSLTPIIFLTAFNDDIKAAQGYASGAADYLPTPVVPEILKAKVKIFIELFQMRQQAAHQAEEKAKRIAAEQADQRKDEFLATLAHELRNPLAPLRNVLHVLQNHELSQEQTSKSYQLMEQQLDHMVRLVDDLMDVSRITRGKIALKMEDILLSEVIDSAVETTKPLLSSLQQTLRLEIPNKPIIIRGDFVRISQIFSNLLNNASKYSDRGTEIKVSAQVQSGKVIIQIIDNGIGIEPKQIPHIFDMFMQVDNSISRSQGGLGIGLTLVKNLTELLNGNISAKSEGANKGSTFTLEFPLVEQTNIKSVSNVHEIHSAVENKKRILIVDDNAPSGQTIGWMLDLLGHETMVLTDGERAIDVAKTYKPEIVLLDIGLPKMNGYQVCEAMKKQPELRATMFIAQTGWGQEEHRKRSKEAGFSHHLVKPIDYDTLKNLINSN